MKGAASPVAQTSQRRLAPALRALRRASRFVGHASALGATVTFEAGCCPPTWAQPQRWAACAPCALRGGPACGVGTRRWCVLSATSPSPCSRGGARPVRLAKGGLGDSALILALSLSHEKGDAEKSSSGSAREKRKAHSATLRNEMANVRCIFLLVSVKSSAAVDGLVVEERVHALRRLHLLGHIFDCLPGRQLARGQRLGRPRQAL